MGAAECFKSLDSEKEQKKHVYVDSLEEYFSLPRDKRTRKCWSFNIYMLPFALELDMDKPEEESEWGKCYKFIKKEFPIQYFFREVVWNFVKYRVVKRSQDLWYIVKCNLYDDKNRYLRKLLPRTWADKPELFRQIVFAMIQHYAAKDGENALEIISWDNDERHKEQRAFIDASLKWIRIDRPLMEKALDSVERGNYKRYIEIEDEIDKRDEDILAGFVKWHRGFWS